MKKNLIIYLTVIGLIGFLSSCNKDETMVVILASPTAPALTTVPELSLSRVNGTDTLTFVGTPVEVGFQASVTYFLEACSTGDNFVHVTSIMSANKDFAFKITVSDLNGILLRSFEADKVTSADFRIRSVLVADVGTGVAPLVYSSSVISADVKPYGLPRLNLIGLDGDLKIESALGDGQYAGIIKLDITKPFKLYDPEANISYGDNGGVLAVNGADIIPGVSGYHNVVADTKALTYKLTQFEIGLIGSATPNAWNSPDTKMDYDSKTGTWYINNVDLIEGEIKFRFNDGWAWNLGWNAAKTALEHNGANIAVTAGNYNIRLTITQFVAPETGTFTITKN
ncbi:MAG: SusE domain-containing protein [Bacteroidales bacterium]|nr:SusE domain-containing protein [Bacteroidales bacterium]